MEAVSWSSIVTYNKVINHATLKCIDQHIREVVPARWRKLFCRSMMLFDGILSFWVGESQWVYLSQQILKVFNLLVKVTGCQFRHTTPGKVWLCSGLKLVHIRELAPGPLTSQSLHRSEIVIGQSLQTKILLGRFHSQYMAVKGSNSNHATWYSSLISMTTGDLIHNTDESISISFKTTKILET